MDKRKGDGQISFSAHKPRRRTTVPWTLEAVGWRQKLINRSFFYLCLGLYPGIAPLIVQAVQLITSNSSMYLPVS